MRVPHKQGNPKGVPGIFLVLSSHLRPPAEASRGHVIRTTSNAAAEPASPVKVPDRKKVESAEKAVEQQVI